MVAYANEWSALFIGVHGVVVVVLGGLLFRHAEGRARYGGVGLAVWLAATVLIVSTGITEDFTSVISPLGFIMTTVIMLGLAMILGWQPLQRALAALPLHWLMAIQLYRVVGIVFLFGWLAGELPTALGPVTALYDVFIGLTAPLIAFAYVRYGAVRLAQLWNIIGILDFVYAITIGVLAAPHALRLLTLTPDTSALGLLPLALITLWAVPLSVFLHVACLVRLSATAQNKVSLEQISGNYVPKL